MKAFPSRYEPAADEQAALWAARLDGGSLSGDDRRALEAWLAEAPTHRDLLSHYCQFSADLETQLPALLGAVRPPVQAAIRRRARRWMAPVALAAAAGVAVAIWLNRPGTQFESLATLAGQRQSFTLSDGTRVELYARTHLQIELGRAERRVRLADGEAFFMVSKDKTRPFTVETPGGSVRVTGTTFDVRTDSASALDVTVVEGKVQVRPGDPAGTGGSAPVLLGAGDHLAARADQVSVHPLSTADLEDALAWRQGEIISRGAPLGDALASFARYHGIRISAEPDAGRKPLGGRFSLDDLDGFLATEQDSLGIRVAREPDGAMHVSLRPQP